MAADAAWEVQKALRAKLAADAPLITLLANGADSIFDDVPEEELFPYITIGDIESEENETCTEAGGQEHIVTINTWASRSAQAGGTVGYEGRKRVRDIIDAVNAALNRASLTLTGFTADNMTYRVSGAHRDDDDTYRGFIRMRIVTAPT